MPKGRCARLLIDDVMRRSNEHIAHNDTMPYLGCTSIARILHLGDKDNKSIVHMRTTNQRTLYNYSWNVNLAAIFEAELKATIDNQEPQKTPIFKRCFQP